MHQGRSAQIGPRMGGFAAPRQTAARAGASVGHCRARREPRPRVTLGTGNQPNPVSWRGGDVGSSLRREAPVPLGGSAPHADLWPGR